MKTATLLTGLFLAVLVPNVVFAQDQVGVAYVGNYGWHYGGYYVGPYKGVVPYPGGATIDMFCVDAAHDVTSPWTAWVTPLTSSGNNLSNTYLGVGGWDQYWQAAYLTTKMYDLIDSNTATNASMGAIHAAIWDITGSWPSGFNIDPSTSTYTLYSDWMKEASANSAAFAASRADQYVLLTDVNRQSQEFLVKRSDVVPEPGTWLLLLTGLVGVAGMAVLKGGRV